RLFGGKSLPSFFQWGKFAFRSRSRSPGAVHPGKFGWGRCEDRFEARGPTPIICPGPEDFPILAGQQEWLADGGPRPCRVAGMPRRLGDGCGGRGSCFLLPPPRPERGTVCSHPPRGGGRLALPH